MHLSPREIDKLLLHNAGFLAQKRLARGVRLNHPESVALIATPDELIRVKHPPQAPGGIDWKLLPAQALDEMPVLAELKRLLASKSGAGRRRKGRP